MLNKLITSLKENLPEPLRKKLGMESESSESDEHSEEETEESHDSSDNEQAPEDKKKNQASNIIRVVVILALAYFAVDEFLLKPEAPQPVTDAAPVKSRRKKPEPPKTAEATTEKQPEALKDATPKQTSPEAPAEIAAADKTAPSPAETPPVENINIADKKAEEAATPPAEPAQAPAPATPETIPDPVPAPETAPAVETAAETPIDKSIDSLIDAVDGTEKKADDSIPAEKKETRLEDKIVADDVYTPPPAYDHVGRGLVYNCKEKYWACIDKASYISCNKNMVWNKSKGKTPECSVLNVYNSEEDCNTIQKYNVSTGQPTQFCQ